MVSYAHVWKVDARIYALAALWSGNKGTFRKENYSKDSINIFLYN